MVALQGADVVTEIVNGGLLGEKKGINLPNINVKVPSLTEKDEINLDFAIAQGCETIAVPLSSRPMTFAM